MENELPPLHFVAAHGARSREAAKLRRAYERGHLHRVYAGAYVEAAAWSEASSRIQHLLRIHAMMPRLDNGLVVSHRSAAAVHGWPSLNEWPRRIEVTDPLSRASQARRNLSKHGLDLSVGEIDLFHGLRTTNRLRTALDLSVSLPFMAAVVVLDHALHSEAFSALELDAGFERHPVRRGRASVGGVLRFADGRAESPLESAARVAVFELGAPRPELQRNFYDADGFIARCDFYFSEQGVVLETDGLAKYRDPLLLQGRSAGDVVIDERRREQRLRAHPEVRDVIRCEWRDVMNPPRLRSLLMRAGVPVR